MLAWHFLNEDRRLRYGTKERVHVGQKIAIKPPLKICKHGLHAGRTPLEALQYAPGPIVCLVKLSGEILEVADKICAAERTCLWISDATRALHDFACWCAAQALLAERRAGRGPDPISWAAIRAKRDWLEGRINDEQLAAASEAAGQTARITSGAMIRTASLEAAWAATMAAIKTTAKTSALEASTAMTRTMALEAATQAARTTAVEVALEVQNIKLAEMLLASKSLDTK